jgi:hypothetical protein
MTAGENKSSNKLSVAVVQDSTSAYDSERDPVPQLESEAAHWSPGSPLSSVLRSLAAAAKFEIFALSEQRGEGSRLLRRRCHGPLGRLHTRSSAQATNSDNGAGGI